MAATSTSKNYIVDETLPPYKIIMMLAWPVLIEQILSTLVNYADTAMVGSLGAYATAAVSISNPVFMLINGIALSLGVGITALLARSVGAGDTDKAKSLIRHSILLIIYIGVPISIITGALSYYIPLWMGAGSDILTYATQYNIVISAGRPFAIGLLIVGSVFRGRGDTRTPMLINLGMNALNVVGNYLLIYQTREMTLLGRTFIMPGAGWGVAGAAAATAFSQICACVALVVMLYKKPGEYRIGLKESYRIDPELVKPIMSISWPAMLERICMSTGGIVVTSAIASLGTTVLAANTLYLTAESLSFMPGFAFMTSITTMVGQCLGARKPALAKKYTYTTCLYAVGLLSIIATFLYIFAGNILSFFTPDQDVIAIAKVCLRIVAFLQPIQVTAWVFSGALKGAGDTKITFYITAVCSWLIRTLGAFVCIKVFGFGLREAVFCMFADSAVRMVLLFIRFKSGSWRTAIAD